MSLILAQHRSRKGLQVVKPVAPTRSFSAASSRAAEAAARVAARYSQAPSYSQMLSAETSTVWPAALPISRPVSLIPQIAEEPAKIVTRTASIIPPQWEPQLSPAISAMNWESGVVPAQSAPPYPLPTSLEAWESEYSNIGWEPDLRLRPLHQVSTTVAAPTLRTVESFRSDERDRSMAKDDWENSSIAPVEPDVPIHANLIEFPRELVATRRMRPQRAETMAALERQLSIFEVAPDAISTQHELVNTAPAPVWPEPEWSEMEFEIQPLDEPEPQQTLDQLSELEVAPFGPRLTAALVDGVVIGAAGLGMALIGATYLSHPLTARIAASGLVLTFALTGLLYHAFFLILAEDTLGMRRAGISLCTFDDRIPTHVELRTRLGAILLSLVPIGLGVAWVLFDDDHLSWHDRLSKTYPRML